MRKNNLWITALAFGLSLSAYGQQAEGGISSGMLQEIKQAYKGTPADKAIHNAIAGNDINKLAVNNDSKNNFDTYFSNKVNSKGITNQKSSGRCWLFTGLNVIRAQVIAKYNLPEFELSQNYNFFWDQLEKANLFLQGIIDTREKPIDDKMVEWLFKNPIGDGGQFTGISDNLMKYGIVPSGVMVETYSSDNTSRMSNLIGLKLKEYGLELRDAKRLETGSAGKTQNRDAGRNLPYAGPQPRRTSYEIHLDTQRRKRKTGRDKRIHPAIILSGIRGRRFEEQLCHADERSEPRLL